MTEPAPVPSSILDTPQRQLPIAIVAEFFGGAALRQFAETMLPALLVVVATRRQLTFVLVPVVALVVLGIVIVRWWRTRFWVEHDELIFEKGVLNRTRLQVPLDRIQQISTEQGLIQQIFDVRKVSIDTAGSVAVEFSLTAVVYAVAMYVASRIVEGRRKATDRLATILVTTAFLVALAPLVSVVATVLANGIARFDVEFFTYSMRGVVGEGGGAYHAIVGTLIITAIAAVMSIPVGLLSYRPGLVRIDARLRIHPDYDAAEVLAEADARLRERLAFDVRLLGESLAASQITRWLQEIAGVEAVDIEALYRALEAVELHPLLFAALPQSSPDGLQAAELLMLDPGGLTLGVMT